MTACTEMKVNRAASVLLNASTGILAGAALMYFFDPDRGRARRTMMKDKTNRVVHEGLVAADRAVKDVKNRASGLAHDAEELLHSKQEPVDDDILIARVRAKLGHLVENPHKLTVEADDGHVTLAGQIGPTEVDRLVLAVRAMAGVKEVENRMDVIIHQHEKKPGLPRLLGQLATMAGVATLALTKFR
jgi:osmotically-inducible protein OsmY